MTMKTPNSQKLLRIYKSASEQQLQKASPTEGKPLTFKFNVKVQNSQCFKPKVNNHKSETVINRNSIGFKEPQPDGKEAESQLIPTPKTPKHPKEVLRKSLIKLKSIHWNESVLALQDIVQISRFNPQLLAKSMPAIYKGIITLLKSLRKTAARTACQAANELFMNMPVEQGPEFDELVQVLLQKSADPNKNLRKDALEALDSMVIHVPPTQTIEVLLHRRIAGYNLNVRTTASKLLACVLGDSDAHSGESLNEDTKIRLVLASMRFLQDDCYDIKLHGMRLATTLMHHKDFEEIFRTKINTEVLNQINNVMEVLKCTNRPGNI